MKTLILAILVMVSSAALAQKPFKKVELNLRNAVIIGQMDQPSDRYSAEINLTELFSSYGVKSMASLNLLKLGSDSQMLASDSIAEIVKNKGFDTYVLVSVRGFDRRYKVSGFKEDFKTALGRGNLFGLSQTDMVSISIEFKFYRAGQMVYADIIKCGNVSDRDTVIKKLRKKAAKRLLKRWK